MNETGLNETELMWRFIAEVPQRLPHVRVFRRNIVNAIVQKGGRTFHAKSGIKGQADAYALVRGGRIVEIETKASRGRLSAEQETWRAFCHQWGIPHLVLKAQASEAPTETVARWISELGALV